MLSNTISGEQESIDQPSKPSKSSSDCVANQNRESHFQDTQSRYRVSVCCIAHSRSVFIRYNCRNFKRFGELARASPEVAKLLPSYLLAGAERKRFRRKEWILLKTHVYKC
jgi:hypothetical protein